MKKLTQTKSGIEHLKNMFEYDPVEGTLQRAGYRPISGHTKNMSIGGVSYRKAHIIYAVHMGRPKEKEYVFFLDGDAKNMKWDNIVESDRSNGIHVVNNVNEIDLYGKIDTIVKQLRSFDPEMGAAMIYEQVGQMLMEEVGYELT